MDSNPSSKMFLWLVVAWILAFGGASQAKERVIVVVFDMEDRGAGVDPGVLSNLTAYLASLLGEGGYQVVPRDQIRERLKSEKRESYKDCYDQSCQIELGRELAAQKTLATQVLKIGKTCQVVSNLYDLKKAATDISATQSGPCDEESLLDSIRIVAKKICSPMAPEAKAPGIKVITEAPVQSRPDLIPTQQSPLMEREKEDHWYTSWWFWTLASSLAAGGVVSAVLLTGDSEDGGSDSDDPITNGHGPQTGTISITW